MVKKTTILEWYRWDQGARLRAVLGRGALLTLAGALLVSHGVGPVTEAWSGLLWLGGLGLLLTAAGPLSAILGLRRVLQDDQYIALRHDGLLLHTDERHRLLAWDELERVQAEGTRLRFTCRDGTECTLAAGFAGIDPPRLAQRIDEVRRKASWGLLHTLDGD